ncbi:MAG: hypothetical protein QOI89_3371 [Solirubrobacteraceae bacterium]|jgi:hypothetical protein|nr:hypothetical protein [Solirubrobacteraceae bacterium]
MFRQKLGSDLANSWCGGTVKGRENQTLWGHVGEEIAGSPPGTHPNGSEARSQPASAAADSWTT